MAMIWDVLSPEDRWILSGRMPSPSIIRRVPQSLTLQHHAHPKNKASREISSFMAEAKDPKDHIGMTEIWDSRSIGTESESKEIESPHKGVSWNVGNPGHRFLICETSEGFETFQSYAHNIADIFHAKIQRVDLLENQDLCLRHIRKKASEGYGLIILGPEMKSYRQHLLAPLFHAKLAMELSISLLVVPKKRWPISRILVLVQGEAHDDAAVEWGIHFSKACNAEITLLAVVPQVPVMYQGFGRFNIGLPELLSTKTKLGMHLRCAAKRLVDEGLGGTVQLHQGLPELQIRIELLNKDHDIVVVGAEDQDWFRRIVFRGDSCRLLQWLDRPLLIAK
jgi:nucleotide-binding universal stress UspA family protein